MKGAPKIILTALLTLVWVAAFIGGYIFWTSNTITKTNRLKARAKQAFYARNFLQAFNLYQTLFDSLNAKDDAASMNYANSAFMSSSIVGSSARSSAGGMKLADSTLSLLADVSEREYSELSNSANDAIASQAYNQRGYSMLKVDHLLRQPNADSALSAALDHFKNALRRNPDNDSARYNYALVRKLAAYPQEVMKGVRSLVAEHRYREAAELLEASMQKNPSLQKQREYLGRLKQIVGIDSIYKGSR
jgi:tetratricopeptide (TPR) repeat protein